MINSLQNVHLHFLFLLCSLVPSISLATVDDCADGAGNVVVIEGKQYFSDDSCEATISITAGSEVHVESGTVTYSAPIIYLNGPFSVKQGASFVANGGPSNAGFEKLDSNGDPLPDDTTEWVCVKDDKTGLVWEKKTTDGGFRDMNNTYTWEEGLDYAEVVSNVGLCGASDWRVPTIEELKMLVHCSTGPEAPLPDYTPCNPGYTSPTIETRYFPNTEIEFPEYYWSASESIKNAEYASCHVEYPGCAWGIAFGWGDAYDGLNKHYTLYVRLVRGGQGF